MVPFRLSLFGPPTFRDPHGEFLRLRTRKHFALLIYLSIESRRLHKRARLASMLWPDASGEEARHSLATGLWLLRGKLGSEAFDGDRGHIRLVPGFVSTDVDRLESQDLGAMDPAPVGQFLDDFEIDDAPEFSHWRDALRARLLPNLHAIYAAKIEQHRRTGDSSKMEGVACRLLELDDLCEVATRAKIEARAMAGDRIGGLRVFERWQARLERDLGALPSHQISQLVDRLRQGPPTRSVANQPSSVPIKHRDEHPFIGRAHEFETCYNDWLAVRSGAPRYLLIKGESGIGKTTLVGRLVTMAALEGAVVARVKCYEMERELPFSVISGLVEHLLDLPGAAGTTPEHLAEVGRIVSKVRQRFPSLPQPTPAAGEGVRMLLTDGVLAILVAVAEEQPVVLAIDDVDLADVASLAILHLVLRRMTSAAVLLLVTSGSSSRGDLAGYRRFLDGATSAGLRTIAVEPLTEVEAATMLDSIAAIRQASGAVRRAILSAARGNPMVLGLLVADWSRNGSDCLALSLGSMNPNGVSSSEAAFRALAERSLNSLDQECRAVAELGAVLGRRLNDMSMYTLLDMPAARTLRAMTSLAGQRILRDAGGALEFANEFLRGQCYIATPSPLRRAMHGAVADRLVGRDHSDGEISGLEIAWHLVRANRLVEAVPYLLAGGRAAIRTAAPHEADLALSTGLPALTGEARRTATLLLAEAQQELGRWADSLHLLDAATDSFDVEQLAVRDIFRILARRWLGQLRVDDLIEATNRLHQIATRRFPVETRVRALAASVRLLALTRHPTQLADLESEVAKLDTSTMDAYQQIHAILVQGWVLALRHETAKALAIVRKGIQRAEGASITGSITVRLLVGEGNLLCMAGDYDHAVRPLERAALLASKLDNETLRGECACQLAVVHGRLGQATAQIDWARIAISSFKAADWSAAMITAVYELGLGLTSEGRDSEACVAASALSQWERTPIPDWALQGALLCEADVLALAGNTRQAFTTARRAIAGTRSDLHHVAYAGQYARWMALIGLQEDRVIEMRERLRTQFPSVGHLDKKDEVEVLAATAMLDGLLGTEVANDWLTVDRKLGKLPKSVAKFLNRFGENTRPFRPSVGI